ncbi:hypothetical protein ACEN2T_17830 [Pseudomonas sp. W22_MBD1_FP4]|uniref:hypothetical protein n=1 Tax=Pseudomonas sp. W22_MBD1_FP4 TaxID=3240272 RepID=UPI003F9442EA
MTTTPTEQRVFTTPYNVDGGERREASTQGTESIVDSLMRDYGDYVGQKVLSMRISYIGGVPRYIASLESGSMVTINILTGNSPMKSINVCDSVRQSEEPSDVLRAPGR